MKLRTNVLTTLAGIVAIAGSVSASVTGPAIRCDAWSSDGAHGSFEVGTNASDWVDGVWQWTSSDDYYIYADGSERILAEISGMNIRYVSDPQISLGFLVHAGNTDTVFSISSGLLSFPAIDAEGRASAGITLTDIDGNVGNVAGGFPGNRAYQATFNGGPVFANLVGGFGVGAFNTLTNSESNPGGNGFVPMGIISSMQAGFNFTLSANDDASGTSTYVTRPVPTPGAVSLLGLAGLAATRRRR